MQAQILELVRDLRQKLGMAIIWITHDLGVIAGIADRVMVMQAGRIVETGQKTRIFGQPENAYTKRLIAAAPVIRWRDKITADGDAND